MLQAALGLELGDLLLHVLQALLDRGEGLEHLAFLILLLGARVLVVALAVAQFAVLPPRVDDLSAQGVGGGLD